jgi:4-coumarate--CoA ligase (photoactive yellow protein activation family)
MTGAAITRPVLRRIVASLIADETNRSRGRIGDTGGSARVEDPAAWDDDRALSVGGLPLDSLETVNAGAALYEMFGLEALEQEGRRGAPATVGHWLDDISTVLRRQGSHLTLMTSGSTGRAKPCVHAIADLQAEAAYFATVLPSVRRVVALVPAHHIYGLIWTAMLPEALGVPVISASVLALPRLEAGDLIVAVPDHWGALVRTIRHWPAGVCGISAGAPLADALAGDLRSAGLERLCDVYGASETGGIALRDAPDAPYRLLPRWQFATPINGAEAVIIDASGREVLLPDRLSIALDHSFAVEGRRDGAVQVGGINVWPEQVAGVLRRYAGVADCTVRLGDRNRLKAFVVPADADDEDVLRVRISEYVQRVLLPEQRPTAYVFGASLPRNALGKVCDWA